MPINTDYQRILQSQETKTGELNITVRFPTLRYLNDFVRLNCADDMLSLDLFPNAKEITESFAAYHATKKLGLALNDPKITVYVIGDGNTPRTAATFAFRSAWTCISIDPLLSIEKEWSKKIKRLSVLPVTIEDCATTGEIQGPVILVYPHSHAPIAPALDNIKSPERHLIYLSCCKNMDIKLKEPDFSYDDWGIHSPQRRVLIWRNV